MGSKPRFQHRRSTFLASEPRVLIVPGNSVLLQRVAQKLESRPDVSMMNTANAMLWYLRRSPVTHVLSATELDDFDAVALADIVPALNPAVHLILCGPETPELAHATKQSNVELVSSVHGLVERLGQLKLGPLHQSPSLDPTNMVVERDAEPAWPERTAPSGTQVLNELNLDGIERVLRTLAAETQAEVVLVSDLAGMTIAQVGEVPVEAGPLYAPMLGTLFFTGAELGRMLDGVDAQRLYVHGGLQYQVYAMAIGEHWILSTVRRSVAESSKRQPMLAALQRAGRALLRGKKL